MPNHLSNWIRRLPLTKMTETQSKVYSLQEIAIQRLLLYTNQIQDIGTTPPHLLLPIFNKMNYKQLNSLEENQPLITQYTDLIWKNLILKDFPNYNINLSKLSLIKSYKSLYFKHLNDMHQFKQQSIDRLRKINQSLQSKKSKIEIIKEPPKMKIAPIPTSRPTTFIGKIKYDLNLKKKLAYSGSILPVYGRLNAAMLGDGKLGGKPDFGKDSVLSRRTGKVPISVPRRRYESNLISMSGLRPPTLVYLSSHKRMAALNSSNEANSLVLTKKSLPEPMDVDSKSSFVPPSNGTIAEVVEIPPPDHIAFKSPVKRKPQPSIFLPKKRQMVKPVSRSPVKSQLKSRQSPVEKSIIKPIKSSIFQ